MSEHLDLDILRRGTLGDLTKRAFPGQHDPLHAHVPAPCRAGPVVNGHLRGGMNRKRRKAVPENGKDAQVLHKDCVHPERMEIPEHLHDLRQFLILDENIHRDMDAHMMKVREVYRLFQLFPVKVPGTGARGKG